MIKQTTGAIESIKDNRNINYAVLPQATAPVQLPSKVIIDISMLPVENQGSRGACVAYTIAKMIQYKNWKETGKVIPISKRYVYTIARAISGWKGQTGEGLMPLFGFKAVKNGSWDRDVLDNTEIPHAEYENMPISEEMKLEAYLYRIAGFAEVTDEITLKKALNNGDLVAVSLPYGGGNFNQAQLSPFTVMDSRHYVVIKGYEDIGNRTKYYFRNHWTEYWGDKGEGSFYWDEYKGLAIDMFTITDVPNEFVDQARETAFQFTSDISKGTKGPIVIELQKALSDLGYYTGPVTGFYGDLTAGAVTQFQIRMQIPTNYGKNVGPKTRAKLNELLALLKKKPTLAKTSEAGKQLIKRFEGLHDGDLKTKILEPQKDPVGLWTLGWGARYDKNWKKVTEKTPAITIAEADELLTRDLQRFEAVVNKENLDLTQNEYDALVSFAYNLGSLFDFPTKIRNHSLTKDDFMRYVYAKGQKLIGLQVRRATEASMYFGENLSGQNGYNLVEYK